MKLTWFMCHCGEGGKCHSTCNIGDREHMQLGVQSQQWGSLPAPPPGPGGDQLASQASPTGDEVTTSSFNPVINEPTSQTPDNKFWPSTREMETSLLTT